MDMDSDDTNNNAPGIGFNGFSNNGGVNQQPQQLINGASNQIETVNPSVKNDDDMGLDSIINKFLSLGTTDKDVLTSQFQQVIGGTITATAAQFFLDMSNWNLGVAIGAYYDLLSAEAENDPNDQQEPDGDESDIVPEQPRWPLLQTYSMALLDELHSLGEVIQPSTPVVQRWRLLNNGHEPWPLGTTFRYHSGTGNLANSDSYMLPEPVVKSGEVRDIGLEFTSPLETGNYEMRWSLATPEGVYFGDEIRIPISVGLNTGSPVAFGFNGISTPGVIGGSINQVTGQGYYPEQQQQPQYYPEQQQGQQQYTIQQQQQPGQYYSGQQPNNQHHGQQ